MNALAFLVIFVQLLIVKPTSKIILVPVILNTAATFAILIGIDFFLELQMTKKVVTPKEALTKTEAPEGEESKIRLKVGYLVIYCEMLNGIMWKVKWNQFDLSPGCLCIVAGFIYWAYKDFEEYLESQEEKNETPTIVVSHIT